MIQDMPDVAVFAIALIVTGALLFLLVYFVITLSDVECDYLNAQQCCANLNFWVMPKVAAHTFLAFIILVTGHWWMLFANLPAVCWQIRELYKLPTGNMGLYDPTEIHNRGMIRKHLKDCMIFLGFYLVMFFIYLYCMIQAMLAGDPIKRHEDDEIVTEF